jgi:hypothetical protein
MRAKRGKESDGLAIASGTRVSARLLTSLNAKKAKPGQRVVAKVTQNVKQNGRVVIRKNSKLIGHVVSAQASGKGRAGSSLEVAFDRLVRGKSSTALSAAVTSILSVPRAPMPAPMAMQPMPQPMSSGGEMGGGGLVGGVGGAVGSTVGSAVGATAAGVDSTMGATGRVASGVTGMAANGIAVTNSAGVGGNASAAAPRGLAGAQLGSSASGSNRTGVTSVFSRRRGNVELNSGTQLQFEVVGSAHAGAPGGKKR